MRKQRELSQADLNRAMDEMEKRIRRIDQLDEQIAETCKRMEQEAYDSERSEGYSSSPRSRGSGNLKSGLSVS